MSERIAQLRGSRAATFFNSFSPSSKAALIFAIPFTVIDAIHYYTAGTAIVFSLPVVLLIYLFSGVLAGKFAFQENNDYAGVPRGGILSGVKLWLISTITNTLISILIGTASLGVTLLLGIPYLVLCAPTYAIGGATISYLGSLIYLFVHKRLRPVI